MTTNKLAEWMQYLRWLGSQLHTMQQQPRDAYRIVDTEISKTGAVKLVIQVVGKSITFKATPEELAADDRLLEFFSRQDVRLITYHACQEIKKPKTKIIFQNFCERLNKMMFGLKIRGVDATVEKTSTEISCDKTLLKEMSPEDAHLIGYTTGTEHILQEREQLKKITEQSE